MEVGDACEQIAQAPRLAEDDEHRGGRDVDRPRQLAELRALRVDPLREHRLLQLSGGDHHVKVVDLLLDVGDLSLEVPLLGDVVVERLLELLLRSHRVGKVAPETRPNLVDECFLLRRIGRGRTR